MQATPPNTSENQGFDNPSKAPVDTGSMLDRLKRLVPYFGRHRWAWAVMILASTVIGSTEVMMATAVRYIVDDGFTKQTMPLWMIPLGLVGIFVIRGIAQFVNQYSLARISNHGMYLIRTMLFERLMRADIRVFQQNSASKLANTVVYETQNGSQQLVGAALILSRDGFSLVALIVFLLYLNWQLTLLVFLMVPFIAFIMKVLSKRLYKVTKMSQDATDELAYVVEENSLANRMVRLHAAQTQQVTRFNGLSRRLEGLAIRSTIASAAMTPLTQIMAAGAISVIVCLAMWQSRTQDPLTVGAFMQFALAMLGLVAPMRRLTDVANPLTRGVAALERGLALLDSLGDETGGSYTKARALGHIQLQSVSVQFDEHGAPALRHLSVEVEAGQTVALVGPSGAGKTTLVNLLPRFLEPSGGQLLLDGQPLAQWDMQSLRNQFAMVSQDVVMLNVSVAENVALGTTPDEKRVQACLDAANLGDLVASLPQGMHTLVGHNASKLSGGQRQRLAIARALYKDAPILILDEATSALDTQSERLVQEALQRLMVGRTTLVIAHRLSTIEHADRVVVMERGQIVEQGTHASLLADNGLYARLHHVPADSPAPSKPAEGPAEPAA